jgi:hypothetical protein
MVPRRIRILAFVALVASFLAFYASRARAEEGFVLDNGAVLRGTVVREDDKEVVFRLTGVGRENRVTIEKSRITQRFVTVDSKATRPEDGDPMPSPLLAAPAMRTVGTVPSSTSSHAASSPPPMPDEEPEAKEEDFFRRTARRAMQAFPKSPAHRAALAALAIALLLALVEIGGRMVDVEGLTLGKSTTLALLLGLLLTVDAVAADSLLLADRAPVLIVVELFAWVGCAAGVLRCGIGQALQLFAFVVFSGALVLLVTAGVLVAV